MCWNPRVAAMVGLCCLGLISAAAQSPNEPSAEVGTEQEDSQKAGAAGEAPPSDERSTPAAGRPRVAGKRQDAREHLARIEEIVQQALDGPGPTESPGDPVGTAGTPPTSQSGERLLIDRSQLEEIQMHLQQIRLALGGAPRKP